MLQNVLTVVAGDELASPAETVDLGAPVAVDEASPEFEIALPTKVSVDFRGSFRELRGSAVQAVARRTV